MSTSVLIIDDSALMREMLARSIGRDGDLEVVGLAADPLEAREKIRALNPDVVTLDIEMPNMNGLKFLHKLMRLRPMPVVMVSSLTHKGATETLLALELGAVDFVPKPKASPAQSFERFGALLREKLRAAALADVKGIAMRLGSRPPEPLQPVIAASGAVIALGASTGGVEAIRAVLSGLPVDCPPVLVAQHMPTGFTSRFAARLDEVTQLSVSEAKDGVVLKPGHAYVAPGDHHLGVRQTAGGLACRISREDPLSGHRPSVDFLFSSVAEAVGPLAVAAILTGMGRDGANGLKRLRDAGAHTIGQNKASALVYGMPRVAFEEGAVIEQVSLDAVARAVAAALNRQRLAA